jgi:hypothetical protein
VAGAARTGGLSPRSDHAKVDAETFAKLRSTGEIALGAALLLPIVPTALAGAGLATFAGGLLSLHLRTPGMRHRDSLRPTSEGIPLAKDIWMFGIGIGFVLDGLLGRKRPAKN